MHPSRLKKLLRDINDKDASKRRFAAVALSEGDERALYPLIKALRDENFGVQDAAMRSLMDIKGETTAYMVLPLLREDSFLRNTAIIILREMGKIAIPLLHILLNDKDDDVRKFAIDIITDVRYCNYTEKLVEMLTGDSNANVRAAAAKAIGALQYRKAIPELITALGDDEWVCFSALESLTDLKDEKAIDSIGALLDNSAESIRFGAIEALGKIGSPRGAEHLTKHLSKTSGYEKTAIIKSLVQTGSFPHLPGIEDSLIEMLMEDDWDDIFTAIKGLAALKSKKAVYHMIDLAGSLEPSDPENEDRLYVLREAIQGIGCNKILINCINDNSIKYRGKAIAIEITGDLKCREAVPALIKSLKSAYRDVRRSTIKSLAGIDDDQSRGHLIEAIRDNDSHVRKTAITALGRIGELKAFGPLMEFLPYEKYDDVRDEFIAALLSIDSALFLSRIDEFDAHIKEKVSSMAQNPGSGAAC